MKTSPSPTYRQIIWPHIERGLYWVAVAVWNILLYAIGLMVTETGFDVFDEPSAIINLAAIPAAILVGAVLAYGLSLILTRESHPRFIGRAVIFGLLLLPVPFIAGVLLRVWVGAPIEPETTTVGQFLFILIVSFWPNLVEYLHEHGYIAILGDREDPWVNLGVSES